MLQWRAIGCLAGILVCCGPIITQASAECVVESREGGSHNFYKVHLSAGCTEVERESHAVDASKLVEAFQRGQGVDLSGVVIRGDIVFDLLPAGVSSSALDGMTIEPNKEVRSIAGGVSIVNSIVRGTVKHQSAQGLLIFRGPVVFAGTRFEQMVDLSRSVFTQPVTLSGAVFLRESYFVQGRFLREVQATKTAFGPHTRFHLSRFHEPVTFQGTRFNGLAEFLEVTFDREADFPRALFNSGTGFSGSQFKGRADFSETAFEGDAFFTFTRFDGDCSFRRARFRATADYDDAQFSEGDDFSETVFEKGVHFTRTKRPSQGSVEPRMGNPAIQYAITLALLAITAVLLAYLIRRK